MRKINFNTYIHSKVPNFRLNPDHPQCKSSSVLLQSRTQSPLALWSAGGRQYLVPRVLWLFGQRVVASRDAEIVAKYDFFIGCLHNDGTPTGSSFVICGS